MSCTVEMKDKRSITVDEKHFYVPAIIRDTCPECGTAFERDLGKHCLSFPPCGVPFNEQLCCGAKIDGKFCDHEWEVTLQLNISVELIAVPVKKKET